jgi:succinoglycan biosynthesis protein ExoH
MRFLLIFGIVILHVPQYVPLEETAAGWFPFIKAFFQHGLFRSTVPVLTCISGFLLFRSCLDQRFGELVAKKTQTLILPLFLWNFPLIVILFVIQSQGLMSHNFSATLYPFDLFTTLDKTFGLVSSPVNYPLNFLRDLFILCLLAPLIGLLLRHLPWIGLAGLSLFFWFNWDGGLVLRNTMPINFYIGGMAAVLHWNLNKLDRFALPFAVLLIACCALIVALEIGDRRWFRVVSPILIWPMMGLIVYTALGRVCRRLAPDAFFIFLSHGPLLLAIWLAYSKLATAIPYELFWISAPFVVLLLCLAVKRFAEKSVPGLLAFMLGNTKITFSPKKRLARYKTQTDEQT